MKGMTCRGSDDAHPGEMDLVGGLVAEDDVLRAAGALPEATPPEAMLTLGNVGIAYSADGVSYMLREGSAWTALGNGPPPATVEFALCETAERVAVTATTTIAKGALYLGALPLEGVPQADGRRDPAEREGVYAALTDHVMGVVNEAARGRRAFPFLVRYAWRMFDGSHVQASPPVMMVPSMHPPEVAFSGSFDGADVELTSTLRLRGCTLQMRIAAIDAEALSRWRTLVTHLDIFVTPQVAPYDQEGSVTGYWDPSGHDDEYDGTWRAAGEAVWRDHTLAEGRHGSRHVWRLPENGDFRRQICDSVIFRRVKALPLEDVAAAADFSDITESDSGSTSSVQLAESLEMKAGFRCGCVYNSRLFGADLVWHAPQPDDPCLMTGYNDSGTRTAVSLRVWLRKNGCALCVPGSGRTLPGDLRWLYYPDPDAYLMQVGSVCYPLTTHAGLHGAYWFGAAVLPPPPEGEWPQSVAMPSKVCVSPVDNPFLLSQEGLTSIGKGKVLALSPAMLNIAQGQYGQFPVYVFSDEGVWALDMGSDGSVAGSRAVSPEKLLRREALTVTECGVAFLSRRGLMLLSGGTLRELSAALRGWRPDFAALPQLAALAVRAEVAVDAPPFDGLAAAADAVIAYDYAGQRLLVRSGESGWGYLLSLRSGEWSAARLDGGGGACFVTRPIDVRRDDGKPQRLRRVSVDCEASEGMILAIWTETRRGHWRLHAACRGPESAYLCGSPVGRLRLALMAPQATGPWTGFRLLT